jgi:beta-lactam-binding protein with PASTA domain
VGSTVDVQYVFTGGLQPLKVAVPNLINLTKAQATAALQAKSLQGNFQGPQFGFGATKVVGQNPVAGTLVLVGSTVNVQYVYTGGLQPLKVAVPNLINLTKSQAQAALQAKNLNGNFTGPQFGFGSTKVTSQNPVAGTLVNLGSTVNATYVFTGGFQLLKVKVPNVIGKTKMQAKALIEAKGLTAKFVGPAIGIGLPWVATQNPLPLTEVLLGTQVTMTIIWHP